ncbi:hypothetical protein HJA00_001474 [Salmonella enterica]|uniref:hypothetical protein n=1 Tax=Salmonella enterica TaxID=28901 RepID=UPI0008A96D99|nr:hypothetical protein [Salmonella enterica]EAB0069295.1 hypothetical protein [Salmonella enterica subsp. enterica]EBH8830095.1 hypothetical protein [Salmonella enterica subsp. enterica serovar Anatum]EBH9235546.1 hypothetical protein [Salmonella enterica subsp. enterica serovar Manhattan]ECU7961817.1 hypothetical protein [Salmonella enterica subsp. enterica serovar Newport]EDD4939536.1 hypothetical protein [Salmonella enterica subsp. enterica serovar Typhimurium]EDT1463880.1 hypothetical pr
MTELIYSVFGAVAIIFGGLWKLHRNQIDTENRLSKLEAKDLLMEQKIETMQDNHTQIAERVYQMEQMLHGIEKKVVAMDAKFDQVIDLLRQR